MRTQAVAPEISHEITAARMDVARRDALERPRRDEDVVRRDGEDGAALPARLRPPPGTAKRASPTRSEPVSPRALTAASVAGEDVVEAGLGVHERHRAQRLVGRAREDDGALPQDEGLAAPRRGPRRRCA